MTPSFVPKEERKRKLEKKAAREAMEEKRKFQAAKKLAERIAKEYRKDREEKWPWDQHDSTKREIDAKKLARDIYLGMKRTEYEKAAESEKRPKKKQGGLKIGRSSTIEGISEAIGNKLKEKMQRGRETSEKPATKSIESNKSKESGPKEKNASESSQDRKRRPRTKEIEAKKRPVEGSRKRREPRTSERRATKAAIEPSRGSVSDSSGKRVKERKQAKGISDADDRRPKRKRESIDNSKRRDLETRKPVRDERKFRVYEVKMYKPEIRGVHFTTSEDLRKYIDTELPGMKHLPYFKKMMRDAEGHLKLSDGIGDRKELTLSEIRGLSEQTGVPFRTARKWVYGESKPNLYRLAETATTKSENKAILDNLRETSNGIQCVSDIKKRLDTYYFQQDVRRLPTYKRDLAMAHKYFRYLELLKEGGNNADIAQRIGVNRLTGVNWVTGVHPHLIRRAIQIPREVPRDGRLWLPTDVRRGGTYSGFIQVPKRVESRNDFQEVVDQFKPSVGIRMKRWRSYFGPVESDIAFMHALGLILADGHLRLSSGLSANMKLALSKKYKWSYDLGEATCYHLGLVGIDAKRTTDMKAPNNVIHDKRGPRTITGPGFFAWASSNNPILVWMRRSCFGLKDAQKKMEVPVSAEWVLSLPKKLRIAFVQGVCDGDGYVSVNSQYLGLATICNQAFYQRLLRTFNIESRSTPTRVKIIQSESVLRAGELPLFKHAESRLRGLNELSDIIRSRKSKPTGSRLSSGEIDFAVSLHREGLSYGAITRSMFAHFGTSWDISTVEHAIKCRKRDISFD